MIDSPSPLYGLCGVSDASESHSAMSLTPQSTNEYVHKTWSQSSFFVMTCKSFSRETQSIKIILENISTLQYSRTKQIKVRKGGYIILSV